MTDRNDFERAIREAGERGSYDTASRIGIEYLVARRLISIAIDEGYTVSVYDGEETVLKRSNDGDAILRAMCSTDEDGISLHKGDDKARLAWFHFIYGNDGWDVISDHTANELGERFAGHASSEAAIQAALMKMGR